MRYYRQSTIANQELNTITFSSLFPLFPTRHDEDGTIVDEFLAGPINRFDHSLCTFSYFEFSENGEFEGRWEKGGNWCKCIMQ